MIETIIFFTLLLNSFKNKININLIFCIIWLLANTNYFNLLHHIDSIFLYFFNQLININYNVLILIFFFLFKNIKYNINLNFFIFILYFLLDYYNQFKSLLDFEYKLNNNLLNGFFIIHPILIYSFYSFFCFYIYISLFDYKFKLNLNNYKFVIYINQKFYCLIFIFIAIFLGAWWAYQELSWGTWWNWDAIEFVNLIYLITVIYLFHNPIIFKFKKLLIESLFFIINFLFLFLIVRYSMLQSIHNFLSIDLQNQYNIYVYIYLLIFLFIKFYNKKYKYTTNRQKLKSPFFKLLIYLNTIFYFYIYTNFFTLNFLTLLKIIIINYFYFILFYFCFFKFKNFYLKNKYIYIYLLIKEFLIFKSLINLFKKIRIYKFLHINIFLIIFLIIFFFINFKLTVSTYYLKYNLYFYIFDNNLISNYFNLNNLNIYQYNQSLNFINIDTVINLTEFTSYSTQESNLYFLLANWEEYNSNFKNIYLFPYINNFLYLIINMIFFFFKIYKSKIYY